MTNQEVALFFFPATALKALAYLFTAQTDQNLGIQPQSFSSILQTPSTSLTQAKYLKAGLSIFP